MHDVRPLTMNIHELFCLEIRVVSFFILDQDYICMPWCVSQMVINVCITHIVLFLLDLGRWFPPPLIQQIPCYQYTDIQTCRHTSTPPPPDLPHPLCLVSYGMTLL